MFRVLITVLMTRIVVGEVRLSADEDLGLLQDINSKQMKIVGDEQVASQGTAFDLKTSVKEFIAMTLFVIIGCGSAMGVAGKDNDSKDWVLQVSLTFGFAIAALAAATGCQINCAVTLGMLILGKVTLIQALGNFIAQMLGSFVGALFLSYIYSKDGADRTGGLGSNGVSQPFSSFQALVGEFLMTFLLQLTAAFTLYGAPNPQLTAPLSIGLAVFLAHSVLIPIDGCSINPTRSFGPALVASMTGKEGKARFDDMWVFWVGPLLGAAAASGVFKLLM